MIRTKHLHFLFSTSLSRYLSPYNLNLSQSPQMPNLKLNSEKTILKNWWGQAPFVGKGNLKVPVFNFTANQYSGETVDLPSEIFNQPLRRDLIFRLHHYRLLLNKFRTKMTRNRAMTSGSGKKVRPQKKTGSARMGDKRAPHLRKGGKAHGAKPKVYSINLNAKIKIKALCSLLTAKLVEGKIKVVNEQSLKVPKTNILSKIIKQHNEDERTIFCIITSTKVDQNFQLAHRNIKRVIWHDAYNLDVKSLFIADKIYITLKGLEELIENIYKTIYIAYKQPYMPKINSESNEQNEQIVRWNPQQPYQFKFKILAQYLQLYEKVKRETPELLEKQLSKVKKIETLNI